MRSSQRCYDQLMNEGAIGVGSTAISAKEDGVVEQ